MKIVTAEEMQRIDRYTIDTLKIPSIVLMENAGIRTLEIMKKVIPAIHQKNIIIVSGKGNNGGDGAVLARQLFQEGLSVKLVVLAEKDSCSTDHEINIQAAMAHGVPLVFLPDEKSFAEYKFDLLFADVIVDAIFGTGFKGVPKPFYASVIDYLNQLNRTVISIDIPSGVNADTGEVAGQAIRAEHTVALALPKLGHIFYPGAEYTGRLHLANISIPASAINKENIQNELVLSEEIRKILPVYRPTDHKGTRGSILIIAGSKKYSGAAALTANASLKTGAGLVFLAAPENMIPVYRSLLYPEIIIEPLAPADEGHFREEHIEQLKPLIEKVNVIAIGPGLGRHKETAGALKKFYRTTKIPLVIDADGLNVFSDYPGMLKHVAGRAVLTPHPGEFSLLTGKNKNDIMQCFLGSAKSYAVQNNIVLHLKGSRSVTALNNGQCYIHVTGHPGMGRGGSGDVLTGIVGGLAAQGLPLERAAVAGAYLHGAAANAVNREISERCFTASDIINGINIIYRNLYSNDRPREKED